MSKPPEAAPRGFPWGALLALLTGAIGIAFGPVLVRWSEVPPTSTAFLRMALAIPFLAWGARRDQRGIEPPSRSSRDRGFLLLAGFAFACDLGLWHQSIHYTSISNATLLANFAPIFVSLGAVVFFQEEVRPVYFFGLALALLGASAVVGASFQVSGQRVFGDLLGLGTACFYALYQLSIKRCRRTMSASRCLLGTSVVASFALGLAALWLGENPIPPTREGWKVALALALISQVFGQGLIAYSFRQLPAAFASISLLIQPVAATGFGVLLLQEAVLPGQALGAVAVLGGILLARFGIGTGPGVEASAESTPLSPSKGRPS